MKNLEKILEVMEEDFTEEEKKQMSDDAILFTELCNVYDRMSTRGKRSAVQTLFNELLIETEVKKC